MRRLMKLVVERSVSKVVAAIDEGAVIQRIMERIDSAGIAEKVSQMLSVENVHTDIVNEVAENIDKYTVMEHVADRFGTKDLLEYWDKNDVVSEVTENVADHIDHVVKLVGVEHVGIGSDYDGVGDSLPVGLKDVSTYPNLVAELLRRDYSEEDIAAILGGNLLRVWDAVEAP